MLDQSTLLGNLHAGQCLLLSSVQLHAGNAFAGEQPALGFMRALSAWKVLLAKNSFEVMFDWCRYSRPFKKSIRLLTNFAALEELGKKCHHRHRHPKIEGEATLSGRAYSSSFCRKVAALCSRVWDCFESQVTSRFGVSKVETSDRVSDRCEGTQRRPDALSEEALLRLSKGRRKRSSALWAVQLSEALVWRTVMQYKFTRLEHINLQEAKARRSLMKRLPVSKRVVICQDSRVNLGALGKGRSPSESLNRVMRSEAPWILGKKPVSFGNSSADLVNPSRLPQPFSRASRS